MQFADIFSLNSPASWVLWFVVLTLAMYFARLPAHRVILTLTRAIYRALRIGGLSVMRAADRLVLRNREVLLASGREAAERIVEREFERIDAGVRRDLSECPTLNRRLSEQVTKMEEDHDQSKVVPPTPPGWVNAVKAVAEIDSKASLEKAQEQARNDYRSATEARHQHLKNMIPAWRKTIQLLGQVDGQVTSLVQRTQMVGGGNYIGGFKIADIAALVIILVELSMGLFLMESLRITRLFPVIGALSDKMRIKMIWITLTILTSLACVEAGLAYMREILLQDELATSALLRGGDETGYQVQFQWITTAAQMGMGFVLPFALTFVAIPLETFVHSLRTVFGVSTVGFLRGFAIVMRTVGDAIRYIGKAVVDIYDVVIFLPLWLESQIKSHSGGVRKPARGQP
jgi:hypothetical protein